MTESVQFEKKYAIDSQGRTIVVDNNKSVIRYLDVNVRTDELRFFAAEYFKYLNGNGIDSTDNKFVCLIQPFFVLDKLVFFTKTEFSSSSQAVKYANEIERHPEILASKEKTDFLKSIFSDCSGRRWYYLEVGIITFERNLYDGKKINIHSTLPVAYETFIKKLKGQLITQYDIDKKNVSSKFVLISDISIYEPKTLLKIAFEKKVADRKQTYFDKVTEEFLFNYMKTNEYDKKDKYSNQAITCLSAINENKNNVFPIYKEIKICIKKIFKESYGISYKGNQIVAHINDKQKIMLYISGNKTNYQIIVGGIKYSLQEFKEALLANELFVETKWFKEKVKPNIKIITTTKQKKEKQNDVINWQRKGRKQKNGKHESNTNKTSK